MGLIPQIKCSRCDRKYSGLLAKCPYCGARRRKKSTRAVTSDNQTWKMVIGLLLLVVLIAAVIVLVVTSVSGDSDDEDDTADVSGLTDLDQSVTSEGEDAVVDSSTITEDGLDIIEEEEPVEEVEETPTITSVVITYAGSTVGVYNDDLGMREFTMSKLEELQLGLRVTPEDAEYEAVWASSDESVVIVLQTGQITAVGSGTATISVTVGTVTTEVYVRVKS